MRHVILVLGKGQDLGTTEGPGSWILPKSEDISLRFDKGILGIQNPNNFYFTSHKQKSH